MDPAMLSTLAELDPQMADLVQQEKARQYRGIELIASENFTSKAVMEVLGSCLTNKYSEGQPGARYYGGNEIIDQVEVLCKTRALEAFGLDPNEWGVNVQPYSGSPANFAAFTALLNPHDRIMGLGLPSGGHLTHGFYTAKKKVSATSVYFESLPYEVHHETGLVDYDEMAKLSKIFLPKILIGGGSAYPREWDCARMREIADACGSLLMFDMAHISGLVATKECESPFTYADVITTTTHKSLRGPRAGMIFYRKTHRSDGSPTLWGDRIDLAVFPSLQGGPHNHQIGALAVALKHAQTPEFKTYIQQVKKNAAVLAQTLVDGGLKVATNGTDNHLILMDMRPAGLSGGKMQAVCDRVHITLNKNSVHGDTNAMNPGGVRIGAPAMTTRGLGEDDFKQIGAFLISCANIAKRVQDKSGKKLVDFNAHLDGEEFSQETAALRKEVEAFAEKFEMPGFSVEGL